MAVLSAQRPKDYPWPRAQKEASDRHSFPALPSLSRIGL
jgi:hypothetical protein